MITQISAETLSPITHNQTLVITTELLAQLYGTTAHSITKNHRSNADRFILGKHYYKIVGEELATLRITFGDLQISPKTRSLILWTERGAARHAKMLETDQAWEVFEKLEDCYFSQKQPASSATKHSYPAHSNNVPAFRYLIKLTYKDTLTGQVETFTGRANSPDEIIQGTAKRFGMHITEMIVMPVNAYC
ncbi:ORF6N domain-containing protein [Salmonella enterica]|nr:ORF6N domain-containing protein [Salmonella enterica]EAW0614430.1 ORF6N domain-containing protein [Salmonella enterica]